MVATKEPHTVDIPLGVNNPLVSASIVGHGIYTITSMYCDATAAGYEPSDVVGGHWFAALGQPDHDIVESFDVHANRSSVARARTRCERSC